MRLSRPSSPRRALHERSPSHTNSPPASLRHVRSKSTTHPSDRYSRENREEQAVEDDGDDENTYEHDIYTSTPYPTKPEHVLLPSPGKGQQQHPDHSTGTLSSSFLSSGEPSQLAASSSILDHSADNSWFNLVTSSQSWLNDPDSSRSSVPLQTQGHESHDETTVLQEEDEKKTIGSDDMNIPTVRTVNPVVSELPSRNQSVYHSSEPGSSPNVMPLGPPSSPNFVALDTSSLNCVRLGTPSNPDSPVSPVSPAHLRSHSISSSVNSMGTVIRHAGAAPWVHGSSSEHSSCAARSFHSTPPYQSVAGSARSNSSSRPSHGRNGSRSIHSHSRSHTSSSRSGPGSDAHPNTDSSVFVQYPIIHPPSSSGSWAEASLESTPGPSDQPGLNQQDLIPERSESRITSHLSTVPSQWSAECDNSFATEGSGAEPPARPETALGVRRDPSSSLWLINDNSDEQLDNITNLPVRDVPSRRPSSPSAHSRRTSSMRSIQRPGTGSSFMTNVLPTWAKMFYGDGRAVNSTLSLSDPSRPPTGRGQPTDSTHVKRPSTARPKTRHGQRETKDGAAAAENEDPRDPRSHWATPEPEERPQTGLYQLRHSWSPHLYGDRSDVPRPSMWLAPSMDSRTEPFLGRRNLQVWSFCLGFIFPLGRFSSLFCLYNL